MAELKMLGLPEIARNVLTGFLVGFACGGIALLFGIWARQYAIAAVSFVACTVCGALFGIFLAGPVAVCFVVGFAAYRREDDSGPSTSPGGAESPLDIVEFVPPGTTARRRPVRRSDPVRTDAAEPPRRPPVSLEALVAALLLIVAGGALWGGLRAVNRVVADAEQKSAAETQRDIEIDLARQAQMHAIDRKRREEWEAERRRESEERRRAAEQYLREEGRR